uniref:Uncharacterized protein n=1 Tax=Tanacetum cinerariifolium TaxID=118510 RepID=A0A6L2K999_TANCI|nr:hypothetical protein [Tanacetum cinerariifolium]
MEAHFKTIAGKKLNIKEKIDIVLSWPSEEAPPMIKGSLDANEDISVVEVIRVIDDVFDIGESNVESIEVRSEFSEFSINKESVKEVVVGGGEFDGHLDEINLNLSEELADNGVSPIPTSLVAYEILRVHQLWEIIGIGDAYDLMDNGRNHKFVQPNVAEGGRMVLCYVQGSGRRKRKKGVGYGSGRHENYRSGRRYCGRIRIWDPGIKIYFKQHLEDKVVVKECGMIRLLFR